MQDYIFGYGSLIETDSRCRTTPAATVAPPVMASGIARGWWTHGTAVGFSTCFVGIRLTEGATCNGVLYPVSALELAATDAREMSYIRRQIDPGQLRPLNNFTLGEAARLWAYMLPEDRPQQRPTERHPIVQSYVDTCLNGCLELEAAYPGADGFAADFIRTTADWSAHWVNDRLQPRRPLKYVPRALQIDRLLHTHVQEYFEAIRIE